MYRVDKVPQVKMGESDLQVPKALRDRVGQQAEQDLQVRMGRRDKKENLVVW